MKEDIQKHDPARIVEAYLRRHREPDSKDTFGAWLHVYELVHDDPIDGWEITHLLLDSMPSDDALAYVAAGPLEDLLKIHGEKMIDQIAAAARNDERLQLALSGVWLNEECAVYEKWLELLKDFGFFSGRRKRL